MSTEAEVVSDEDVSLLRAILDENQLELEVANRLTFADVLMELNSEQRYVDALLKTKKGGAFLQIMRY